MQALASVKPFQHLAVAATSLREPKGNGKPKKITSFRFGHIWRLGTLFVLIGLKETRKQTTLIYWLQGLLEYARGHFLRIARILDLDPNPCNMGVAKVLGSPFAPLVKRTTPKSMCCRLENRYDVCVIENRTMNRTPTIEWALVCR